MHSSWAAEDGKWISEPALYGLVEIHEILSERFSLWCHRRQEWQHEKVVPRLAVKAGTRAGSAMGPQLPAC